MQVNAMKSIHLDKVIINIGIGSNENNIENAKALIKKLTNHNSGSSTARKRNPEFKLRKGQIIGAVSTLRKEEAYNMLKRALDANNNTINSKAIGNNSLNFGVKEYIYFTGVKYDPKIGILGLNVNAAFARKGKRVERRRRRAGSVAERHGRVAREEIEEYLKRNFNVSIAR